MAFSQFIKLGSLACITFLGSIYANPTSECYELKAVRAECPRRILSVETRVNVADDPARQERCCWSILNIFCTLMEHAGSSYPHPIIRDHRNH